MADGDAIRTGEEAVRLLTEEAVYPLKADLSSHADMVMKGGITSGVVYPLAVCQLARSRRLRNLGGSSAGGIAAGMAAAAEFARDCGGFKRLAALPNELGPNLGAMFQPSRVTKPLFDLLLASMDNSKLKVPKILAAVIRGALWWFLLTAGAVLVLALWGVILVAGAPHSVAGWRHLGWALLPGLLPAFVLGIVAAFAVLAQGAIGRLQANGYGLCRGSHGRVPPKPKPGAVEPFTDWMHTKLQDVADLGRDDVLTFAHLWGDPTLDHAPDDADIRLEVMTTNVTHCRPLRLPFESDLYYFCPTELARYFPPPVFKHLECHSRPPSDGTPWECPEHKVALRHLPHPGKMPVVVAVRMTLSFPALISAVPLFTIDRAAQPQSPIRCWFSDGGISSNFPIHFFDTLWPAHPTFGISLGPYPAGRSEQHVYLRRAQDQALPRARGTSTVIGFFSAIFDTLQNWSDEGQASLPGYRDRIVEIRHTKTEGGMNLRMNEKQIMSMCFRGYLAAKELDDKFNFRHHRWSRYRTAMAELDRATANMASMYDASLPNGDPGYRSFVTTLPMGSGTDPGVGWRGSAVKRTDLLLQFAGRKMTPDAVDPAFPPHEPRPVPDLRIVAHF